MFRDSVRFTRSARRPGASSEAEVAAPERIVPGGCATRCTPPAPIPREVPGAAPPEGPWRVVRKILTISSVASDGSAGKESATDGSNVERAYEAGAWSILKASFEVFNNDLLSALKAAREIIEHQGEKGAELEEEVHEALRRLIPQQYPFTTGEVLNGRGLRSNQQDLVIVHGESVSRIGTRRTIPFEAVVASIEIKTTLDSGQIATAVNNVQSVKRLRGASDDGVRGPLVPFGGIVGLSTRNSADATIKAYGKACAQIADPLERPDALLIVGELAVMPGVEDGSGGLTLFYWSDSQAASGRQIVFKGAEDSALLFCYRLLEHVKQYVPPAFNLLAYASKRHWRYVTYTPDDLKDRET